MFIYTNYLSVLFYCLILTIFLELTISYLLGLRKKDLVNILLVNILTNPLINCIHPLFLFKYGKESQITALFILEILVVLVEGFIYSKYIKYNKITPYILSFILNIISFAIGTVINIFVFR